jgi:hypothetical protein
MDIPQLERYYTWVHKRNCKLQNRLTEFGDIALQIQKNCQPKVQELDRMTTIRKTLIRSGIKTDPIHFLGDFSKSVDEFKIVSAEKSAFENWVKSNGGHVRML